MRRGFTLIELLVVIAIIGVLIGILLPVMGHVREGSRRSACAQRLHQIQVGVMAYALEHKTLLPSGQRDSDGQEHCIWIGDATHSVFSEYCGDVRLACPDLETSDMPFAAPPFGWVLGYNYLAGHPKVMAARGWQSALTTSDSDLPLMADLNDWSIPDQWVIAAHVATPAGAFEHSTVSTPAERGSQGGNIVYLNGSVVWHNLSDLTQHDMYSGVPGIYWSLW